MSHHAPDFSFPNTQACAPACTHVREKAAITKTSATAAPTHYNAVVAQKWPSLTLQLGYRFNFEVILNYYCIIAVHHIIYTLREKAYEKLPLIE